jgi:hypothetical protein
MGSNKEAQAARNEADRNLREANPEEWAAFMEEAHEARGLTWNRRATPEERARREAEEKQAKAKARIEAEAAKAGLSISFNLPAEPEWDEQHAQRVEERVLEAWDANALVTPVD